MPSLFPISKEDKDIYYWPEEKEAYINLYSKSSYEQDGYEVIDIILQEERVWKSNRPEQWYVVHPQLMASRPLRDRTGRQGIHIDIFQTYNTVV
jgi:hypothetical protein